jgi:hypothetical protein
VVVGPGGPLQSLLVLLVRELVLVLVPVPVLVLVLKAVQLVLLVLVLVTVPSSVVTGWCTHLSHCHSHSHMSLQCWGVETGEYSEYQYFCFRGGVQALD